MKVLLIHPHSLGQFEYLAVFLARNPAIQVMFLTQKAELKGIPGVKVRVYHQEKKVREESKTIEKFSHVGEVSAGADVHAVWPQFFLINQLNWRLL